MVDARGIRSILQADPRLPVAAAAPFALCCLFSQYGRSKNSKQEVSFWVGFPGRIARAAFAGRGASSGKPVRKERQRTHSEGRLWPDAGFASLPGDPVAGPPAEAFA